MNKPIMIMLAGASVFAVAASAYANHRDMKDGDNWEAMMASHFAEMDANKDGNVDHDEFIAFQTKMIEQHWEKFSSEAGDDGVVSLEEAKAHHAAMMNGEGGMGMGPNCDGSGPMKGRMGDMMEDSDPDQE